jgi:hypothetical protein
MDIKVDVGEGRREALVEHPVLYLIEYWQAGLFSNVVVRQQLRPSGEVTGVKRFDQAQYGLLGFFRH